MIEVSCLYDGKYRTEKAYTVAEFPFNQLAKDAGKKFIKLPATFDIEATTIQRGEEYESFMYIWQMCVNGFVVFGRTWDEWQLFLSRLAAELETSIDKRLVIYVHNLSYEFEFIRDFIEFTDIFATDSHDVLTARSDDFEFRCSYRLSNMSLEKFIKNTQGTHHNKGVDDLDYKTIRTPATELTAVEYGYCYNDVMGLYECLLNYISRDDLEHIPLTSTGFVRRDCRNAMRKNKKNRKMFLNTKLDFEQYQLLKDCFRGGNTASNRYHTNVILDNVRSWDISSSYPYVMIAEKFPMGKFMPATIDSMEKLKEFNSRFCTIGRYAFKDLKVKRHTPVPYIPYSKCYDIENDICYNGRVLSADFITIALTNIDLDIILNQYDFSDLMLKDYYVARKGRLPLEFREEVFSYFEKKSVLKYETDENSQYMYMKSKNALNSCYGMTVTDPVHNEIKFSDGEWIHGDVDRVTKLEDFYKTYNSFLPYQWGVFVTAYARQRLQKAIDQVGLDTVYCDTDSVKFIGDHDDVFQKINADMIKYNRDNNIVHSVEVNGKTYFLGTWDSEAMKGKDIAYDQFKTLGAKKYAYVQDGHIGITVAGLAKKLGAEELQKGRGLEDFKIGKVFWNSGRTTAYFNNMPVHHIVVDGVTIRTGSNIAIVDTTYTLGITDTMLDIINSLKDEEQNDEN